MTKPTFIATGPKGEPPGVFYRSPSPDGRRQVVLFNLDEPRMGATVGSLALTGPDGVAEVEFPSFLAIPNSGVWSPDSRRFIVAGLLGFALYLLWDVEERRFAVIRVGNPYPLKAEWTDAATLRIEVAPSQIEAANCRETFGEGRAEYPTRRFKAPPPALLNLAELEFFEVSRFSEIPQLAEDFPVHDIKLVEDGYFPFEGPMPESTFQVFNGRPMEVFHLVAFAEYGDATSQGWLDEVRRVSGGRNVHWERVAKLIGRKTRSKSHTTEQKSKREKRGKRSQA